MPIAHVTTWPTSSEKKRQLMEKITQVIHETTGAPLDKITVYVQEVAPESWSDAGIVGSDPDFKIKSRRQNYD